MAHKEIERNVSGGETAADELFKHGAKVGSHVSDFSHPPANVDANRSSQEAVQSVRKLADHGKKVKAHLARPEAQRLANEDGVLAPDFNQRMTKKEIAAQAKRPMDEDGVLSHDRNQRMSKKDREEVKNRPIDEDGVMAPGFNQRMTKKEIAAEQKRPMDEDGVLSPDFNQRMTKKEREELKNRPMDKDGVMAPSFSQQQMKKEKSAGMASTTDAISAHVTSAIAGVGETLGGTSITISQDMYNQLKGNPQAQKALLERLGKENPGYTFSIAALVPAEENGKLGVPDLRLKVSNPEYAQKESQERKKQANDPISSIRDDVVMAFAKTAVDMGPTGKNSISSAQFDDATKGYDCISEGTVRPGVGGQYQKGWVQDAQGKKVADVHIYTDKHGEPERYVVTNISDPELERKLREGRKSGTDV